MSQVVWKALANPIREQLLDLMSTGPATTGDLADAFPELSRYAVMQHLGVLEQAGLVLVRRQGRQRFNFLNPVPIREAYERWVGEIAGTAAGQVLALRRHVEKGPTEMEQSGVVRVENEIEFAASPERVFSAMTTETLQWFPHTYGEERTKQIVCEGRPGGRLFEDWGGDAGHLYGIIQEWDPPHRLTTRAWLDLGVSLDTSYVIEATEGGCVLRVSKLAVGPLTEEQAKGISQFGDLRNFEEPLRAWVERA